MKFNSSSKSLKAKRNEKTSKANLGKEDASSRGLSDKLKEAIPSVTFSDDDHSLDPEVEQELPDFQTTPDAVLLHGYLHVHIVRARRLRDFDCFLGCRKLKTLGGGCCDKNVSDPYVTVHAGPHRLLKTSIMYNTLNPKWEEDYVVPISHFVDAIEFRVKDVDFNMTMDLLGKTYLPAKELVKVNKEGVSQRTGVHRISHLDGKPRHGSLEYYVEYIPADMIINDPVVPGTYFDARQGNDVKLYVNADDSSKDLPKVTYGQNMDRTWKANRLWRDTYNSICQAEHMIYVTGWAVDHTQSLLRGKEKEEAISNGKYSPFIGELLIQKAEEGVTVNIMAWDDQTSNNLKLEGVMATKDEQLRAFFKNTKVNCFLAPMVGGQNNPFLEKIRNSVCFTHHQKLVVCDENGSLVGYVGGIDLTYGRFDDRSYPLFRTLESIHKNDYHNGCNIFPMCEETGPRQPWHDIHLCVRGPAVLDIVQNFEERWKKQNGLLMGKLVDLSAKGIKVEGVRSDEGSWRTQFFRSIDARTAEFDPKVEATFAGPSFDDIKGVTFNQPELHEVSKLQRKIWRAKSELQRTFTANDATGFEFPRSLNHKRGRNIENSIHDALVYHIRRAKHSIYIESQYFLSSSHIWPKKNRTGCQNLVAAELTWKICQAVEDGHRFAAYIVIPMWPEGLPESAPVQEILKWQRLTMEGMYTKIAHAIHRKKEKLKAAGLEYDASPTDYLNFFCLGTRETKEGSEATRVPPPKSLGDMLSTTRRHLVYVHSKMTIVDDEIALIGSANINQRSLDGTRDSEIVQASWQPEYRATKTSVARGEVHGFRLHCWAHLTGVIEDSFRDPASLECVRRFTSLAESNWCLYTQSEVCEMDASLLPYPINVNDDGSISAKTRNGCFPDTDASILGSETTVLPNIVTT